MKQLMQDIKFLLSEKVSQEYKKFLVPAEQGIEQGGLRMSLVAGTSNGAVFLNLAKDKVTFDIRGHKVNIRKALKVAQYVKEDTNVEVDGTTIRIPKPAKANDPEVGIAVVMPTGVTVPNGNPKVLSEEDKNKVVNGFGNFIKILVDRNLVGVPGAKKQKAPPPAIDLTHYITKAVIDNGVDWYVSRLAQVGQLVLTGAPGTGKSHLARLIATCITGENIDGDADTPHIAMCQFHPSFDYSDFVEGLRPKENNGTLGFERMDGVFMEFCRRAVKEKADHPNEALKPFVFIIDEINRGDISKIFGELFFALEKSYRGKKGLKTRYNNIMPEDHPFKKGFFVPENVLVLGTMNDIDRGVESMDFAIRRRFAWMEVTPMSQFSAVMSGIAPDRKKKARNAMKVLNKHISEIEGLGPAYCIGPAYFRQLADPNCDQTALWDNFISPLLMEYLRGMSGPVVKLIYDDLKKEYYQSWGMAEPEEGSEEMNDEEDGEEAEELAPGEGTEGEGAEMLKGKDGGAVPAAALAEVVPPQGPAAPAAPAEAVLPPNE